jgi:hypothetical protein
VGFGFSISKIFHPEFFLHYSTHNLGTGTGGGNKGVNTREGRGIHFIEMGVKALFTKGKYYSLE